MQLFEYRKQMNRVNINIRINNRNKLRLNSNIKYRIMQHLTCHRCDMINSFKLLFTKILHFLIMHPSRQPLAQKYPMIPPKCSAKLEIYRGMLRRQLNFKDILRSKLDSLESRTDDIVSQTSNVDHGVQNFASTLYDSAFHVFGRVKRSNSKRNSDRVYTSPWFTDACKVGRAELKRVNSKIQVE